MCVGAVWPSHRHYEFEFPNLVEFSGALSSTFKTGPQRGSTLRSLEQT